jgi:hypothetical protein
MTLTLEAGRVPHPYLVWHCRGATETENPPLPAHAVQALQVSSKSVSNEGHFTPEDERVPPAYLASHWIRVAERAYQPLLVHAPQEVQVWSKTVSKQGHVTLEAHSVLHPYLASHCSGVSEHQMCYYMPMGVTQCIFGRNCSVTEVTLLLRLKEIFQTISPGTGEGA